MNIIDLDRIRSALDMEQAIEAVKAGFVAYAQGAAQMGAVGYLAFPAVDGDCHIKSAALAGGPYFVVKVASGFPNNRDRGLPANSGCMLLLDSATGQPVCLLEDEGWLTGLRTAIAGVLAARLIRPERGHKLGIIGTGTQARLQALLVARHAGFSQVMAWGRNRDRTRQLAAEAAAQGTEIAVAESVAEVAEFADVLITVTPSREPLVDETMFDAAPRIVAVGADAPGKQELSIGLTTSMQHIVVDSIEQCLDHGEIAAAHRQGRIDTARLGTLGQLLADKARFEPEQSVLVDLTGIGIQDLQIATTTWQSLR